MASAAGIFTISLDFELHWGVHDQRPLAAYARNLLGAREAIPRMLELFERYGVHCTWATVGLLFFDRKADLMEHLPEPRPRYANPALSPYPLIGQVGPNERQDPYHYGLSLIEQIRTAPARRSAPTPSRTTTAWSRARPRTPSARRRSEPICWRRAARRSGSASPRAAWCSPATSIGPTTSRPVAPWASRWCAATIRPGGSARKVAATRACSSAPAG